MREYLQKHETNKDASEERIQSCINSLIKFDKEKEKEFILCENKVKTHAGARRIVLKF